MTAGRTPSLPRGDFSRSAFRLHFPFYSSINTSQVEYAIEAIKLGSTAIGIQTSEGVILAVEKRITSPLMEPTSIEKIVEIDSHIACAFSGLTADSKTLIDRARVESQNHWFTYDEKMQVESVAQAVSNLAIAFGDSDDDAGVMSRPFGVAILFAG